MPIKDEIIIPRKGDQSFEGDVLPGTDGRWNIGSLAKRWRRVIAKTIAGETLEYTGCITPKKGGVLYAAFPMVYLKEPLTSTSWDGDSFSTVGTSTQLDLSSVFGVPAGITAVLMNTQVKDSAGAGNYYFGCGPSSTYWYAQTIYSVSSSVYCQGRPVAIPCDSNGDVWYRIAASGSNTLNVYIRIWGYAI